VTTTTTNTTLLTAESVPTLSRGAANQGPAGNLDLKETAGNQGRLGGTFTLTATDSAAGAVNFSSTPQASVTAGNCTLSSATGVVSLNTVQFTVAVSSTSPCTIRITNIFYNTNTVATGNALGDVTITATGGGVDTTCNGAHCNNKAVNATIGTVAVCGQGGQGDERDEHDQQGQHGCNQGGDEHDGDNGDNQGDNGGQGDHGGGNGQGDSNGQGDNGGQGGGGQGDGGGQGGDGQD
jgi:hypothetical protein